MMRQGCLWLLVLGSAAMFTWAWLRADLLGEIVQAGLGLSTVSVLAAEWWEGIE